MLSSYSFFCALKIFFVFVTYLLDRTFPHVCIFISNSFVMVPLNQPSFVLSSKKLKSPDNVIFKAQVDLLSVLAVHLAGPETWRDIIIQWNIFLQRRVSNFTFLGVLVEECSGGAVLQTGLKNGMSRHLAIKLGSPLSLQIVVGCSGCISCSSPGQGTLREPRSQSQSQPRQLQCHRHHSKPFWVDIYNN